MTQPDSIEALTAQLRSDIAEIWAAVLAAQAGVATEWFTTTPAVRQHRLKELESTLRALADRADEIAARHVTTMVQTAYEYGAFTASVTSDRALTASRATQAMRTVTSFSGIDVNAITVLAQDTYDDLLRATTSMRQSTKVTVRRIARETIRAKLYEGMTAQQAGVKLAATLVDDGVTAIVYANGRRVGLSTYTDMVARTKSALAYQEGMFNQAEALGVGWMEIMDGPGCGWTSHDDPRKADGLIVPLAEARLYPISHPNCRRASSCRPDVESAADAAAASPTTPMGQTADQKAAADLYDAVASRRPQRTSTTRQAAQRTNIDLSDGVLTSPAAQRHAARVAKRATPLA